MIKAKVIADSIYDGKNRLTTLELEYPRYILSQINTHRVFSRNTASSRAIPIDKMITLITKNPVEPIWTMKKSGMVGDLVEDESIINEASREWHEAMLDACKHAKKLEELGIHKQNANRLLEPFQHVKTIITGSDWDNFFKLRLDSHAQPEIQELARKMKNAMDKSIPFECIGVNGYWHTPYVSTIEAVEELGWEKAKKISASCCAQVSYRKLDTSEDKAIDIFRKLVSSDIIHGSALEHVCRPMKANEKYRLGNLRGWHQFRHEVENKIACGLKI